MSELLGSAATPFQFFNRQWDIYRRVLSHNYMFHAEFAAVTRERLAARFTGPYSLLDLGCGDAFFTAQAVKSTPLDLYVGVDLSAPALDLARAEMKSVAREPEYMEGDLAGAVGTLREKGRKFDVVLASYSVHHFQRSAKAEVLSAIRDLLRPDGVFLMVDLIHRDDETRDSFVERYIAWLTATWTNFGPDEIASIADHIRTSDFPECPADLADLAHTTGLAMDFHLVTPVQTEAFLEFQSCARGSASIP